MDQGDPDQTFVLEEGVQATVELTPAPDAPTRVDATLDLAATHAAPGATETIALDADSGPDADATLPHDRRAHADRPRDVETAGFSKGPDGTLVAPRTGVAGAEPPPARGPRLAPTRADSRPRSRYRILKPHARGGLGEVFVAVDEELQREVALKEIQAKHADHVESRTRFLIEAEVTGGLEHPGIVPVYGLGEYEDGRPYYAMRFIRGDSLRKALERFHQADTPELDPGRRELDLRGLLGRFNDVCHAIHYAHCRGVLHRDLKPDNIMLGDFGETLVVDWGLAKSVDRAEPVGTTTLSQLRPMSAGSGSMTMVGSAMGTPQYMSPEQAEGQLENLGPATDVYALGATLYHLVTGAVPYQERTLPSLMKAIKSGKYRPPREANRKVPPALAAICVKAMALRPEDRYPSARAIADDVEHWLGDEPVSVYREPWTVRAARWAKRHKTFVTSSALVLITAVVLLTVSTILIKREQGRTEIQRQLAEANFGQARDAVDHMLTELGEVELADVPQAEPVRKKMLEKALAFYRGFLDQRRADPGVRQGTGQAAIRLGDILEMLGNYDGADAAYHEALLLLDPLAKTDPGPRRDLARAHHQRAILLKKSGRFRASEDEFREAIRLRKDLAAAFPNQPDYRKDERDSLYHLGALLAKLPGRANEVEDAYRAAITEQAKLVDDVRAQPDARRKLARYLNNWGMLLVKSQPPRAEKVLLEALDHQKSLVGASPGVAGYQWELARTHSNLASLFTRIRRDEEAREQYALGRGRLKKLADDFPTVPDYRNELAAVHINLARLDLVGRRDKEAEENLREAIALLEVLSSSYAGRPDYRQRLALALVNVANLREDRLGRLDQAENDYRAAAAIQDKLVAKYGTVPEYHANLGSTRGHEGRMAYLKRHAPREAIPLLEGAIREYRIAIEGDERNPYYREHQCGDTMALAAITLELGDHARGAALLETIPQVVPRNADEICRAGRALCSRCLAALDADKSLSDAKRRELKEDYLRRALALLKEAVKNGLGDVQEFSQKDYDPLRGREEFQRLQRAVETKAKPIEG